MYIEKLHISAFGPLCDVDVDLSEGLNVIEGKNESGKSALAAFIKFIFYGLSAKGTGELSEKQKYVNWSRGYAAGFAVCVISDGDDVKKVRIERTLNAKTGADGKTKYSERVRVLDHESSMPVNIGTAPGDFFFGVPEGVFTGSAYAAQETSVKPDGASLKDAVENIICAADENINVKRASDALDKARVKLLYKKGNGGEIYELEQKKLQLERKLDGSRDEAARLIKAEVSLADVKDNIESSRRRGAELEDIAEAIDVLSAESKVKTADSLKEKHEKSKVELEELSSGVIDDKFLTNLAGSVRDFERAEKAKSELAAKKADGPKERDPDDRIFTDAANARRLGKLATVLFSTGAGVLILGLAGIIFTAFLKFVGRSDNFIIPLIITAFVILGGVGVMVFSHIIRDKYYDILDAWDAEDEDDLDRMASEAEGAQSVSAEAKIAMATADNAVKEAEDSLRSIAVTLGYDHEEVEIHTLIKRLAKAGAEAVHKRRALEAECAKLFGQLEAAEAALAGVSREEVFAKAEEIRATDAGRTAETMSDVERASVSRETAFIRTKLENLRGREIELERECAALRATVTSPAKLTEELEDAERTLKARKESYDALILASEMLEAAGENIRSSVVPRLNTEASGIMSEVTGGKYGELGISNDFEMNFRSGDFGTLELDYLSAGTKDIAYLALRVALVKALYNDVQRPPVIFDESLAFLDEGRVEKAVNVLGKSGVQTLLFTCRSLESSVATDANKVCLG